MKLLAVLVLLVVLFMPGPGFTFQGPLQVKNQFPIFLSLNQPYLLEAETQTALSIGLSHSSTFMVKKSAAWAADLDLELTELTVRIRKEAAGLFELGVDVPVVRAEQGIMDRPLAWYHRTFGFGDYDRHTRPDNDFLYTVRKNGSLVIQGENGLTGFGDVRLTLKRKLIEDGPLVSALASVELPTGNARVGYGSGSPDAGFGLLMDFDFGEATRVYANGGMVFPGDLKAHQTTPLRTFSYAGAGIEYLYGPRLDLIAQFIVQTSPFPHTGISEIDSPGVLLVLGGRFKTEAGGIEISLSEDPNTSGAPDFIINVTCGYKF